jgi:hypothetical protein
MNTKEFLQRALAKSGYYCLLALKSSEDRRVQKFYDSIDELITEANSFDSAGYDTYFALSTFKDSSSRKVSNIDRIQSFFLDLDCGPTKEFASQREALDELREFYRGANLPKPLVITSGRGIHVYWLLAESVVYEDWFPVANSLKKLCAEYGFLADPAVTSDGARVLRVLGTHNHKDDPPVQVLQLGVDIPTPIDFEKFSVLVGSDPLAFPTKVESQPPSAIMQKLMGNNDTKFKNILSKINDGEGCKQIENIIYDQENCPEPMWRAGLSIAKFCSDSEKAVSYISEGHPEYDPEETAHKVDLIKGPYLCAKFDEFSPNICPDCPNWHKIKSPISLGMEVVEADEADNVVEALMADRPDDLVQTYTIPPYPKPYFRGVNGGIYIRSTDSDGNVDEKLLYHNDFYVVKRILDKETGEALVMRLHLPKDGVREFTVPLTSVTSREEFRKHMSMHGVAVSRTDELMQYTTTWVNELQATSMADKAHRQFGWTSKEMKSFVLGSREIFGDRIEFNPPATTTSALFPSFEPRGTLEGWKDMVKFYDRDNFELHQYIVASSFGSVLMELLPVHCSLVHLHSPKSGYGKTTVMEAGITAWGEPEELLLYERDTHAIKMHRGEVYHNLPLYMDELTEMKSKDVSDLAYQIVSGKQRRRMAGSVNAERPTGVPWSLLAVTSGNASLVEIVRGDKADPEAEAQRILEIKVDQRFATPQGKTETDAFSQELKKNYGFAGEIFVQYVINNLEEVRSLLKDMQAKIDREAGLAPKNRFWSAGAACTMTALIICNELELLTYAPKPVYKWIGRVLRFNKENSDNMGASVEQILNDYINEHWVNILQIKSTDDLRKQDNNGLDVLVVPDATPRGRLVARYETDLKRAYLLPKPLRKWCTAQQINYTSFVQDLMEKLNGKKVKMRLCKGTHMKLPSTDVISVDCSKIDLEDLVDIAEEETED